LAWRKIVIAKVKCPSCKGSLKVVRQNKFHLNSDQFDAIRAGDYYCKVCPEEVGTAKKANTGYAYFWASQVKEKAQSSKCGDINETNVCELPLGHTEPHREITDSHYVEWGELQRAPTDRY